jgi:hypothetical protein
MIIAGEEAVVSELKLRPPKPWGDGHDMSCPYRICRETKTCFAARRGKSRYEDAQNIWRDELAATKMLRFIQPSFTV